MRGLVAQRNRDIKTKSQGKINKWSEATCSPFTRDVAHHFMHGFLSTLHLLALSELRAAVADGREHERGHHSLPCSNFAQASAGAGVGGRLGAISSRLMRFHQTATMLRTDRTDAASKEGDRGGRHRARERDRTTRDGMSTTVARQPSCPLLGRSVRCAAAMGGCRMRMDCVLRQKEEDACSLAYLSEDGREGLSEVAWTAASRLL